MATINKFENIEAWQVARKLTHQIYVAANFGYINQELFVELYEEATKQ